MLYFLQYILTGLTIHSTVVQCMYVRGEMVVNIYLFPFCSYRTSVFLAFYTVHVLVCLVVIVL